MTKYERERERNGFATKQYLPQGEGRVAKILDSSPCGVEIKCTTSSTHHDGSTFWLITEDLTPQKVTLCMYVYVN